MENWLKNNESSSKSKSKSELSAELYEPMETSRKRFQNKRAEFHAGRAKEISNKYFEAKKSKLEKADGNLTALEQEKERLEAFIQETA